ncbi:hypothetical protein AMS69_17780 [Haloarcula rubripromontorii]|uniref:Multi-ubiquitin domain-containing protein n=1 Tax=Haloarcula rubripromontorii TaxID=1705562 RepID=A0A0N0U922_9EURY|nr:hypothetical protein [Haloarcula rubripromontorii]KOX91576.1 hypothetical protein AMS69_17780 [Haloarcula rubripromontorii]
MSEPNDAAERGTDQGASTVTFTVKSGRGDNQEFEFEKGTKVGDAAKEVAEEYGYDPNDPTFVHPEEGELDRNKPLAPYHLDGDTVTLVNEEKGV